MCSTNYICPKCGYETKVLFKAGETPIAPVCDKCGEKMSRSFSKIEMGDTIDDESLIVSRMMTYHSDKE